MSANIKFACTYLKTGKKLIRGSLVSVAH